MAPESTVAYVVGCFPAPTETFVLTEMSLLRAQGFEPVVCALERGPDVGDERTGPLLRTARFRPARYACLALSLLYGVGGSAQRRARGAAACYFAERLLSHRPVHVHAHFLGACVEVGHDLACILGTSFSYSCHASDVLTSGPPTPEEHAAVHTAHRVIACTEYIRSRLILDRGYPPNKVVRIPHGTDLSLLPEPAEAAPGGPPVIGAVGRLVPKKGYDVLLRAAAPLLREREAGIELRLIGDGPERRGLEALAGTLEVAEHVRFLGTLPWGKTLERMREFSVLAVPSVQAPDGDTDGLPNVLLEAGALGVPIVASEIAGIPELIRTGETGTLVPPGEVEPLQQALSTALGSGEDTAKLASALRAEIGRNWSAAESAAGVAAVFSQAVATRAGVVRGAAEEGAAS